MLLGTMGLTGIAIVSHQVQEKLLENAKSLLTSDLVVSARRDLFPEEKKNLEDVFVSIPHDTYRVTDIYSMITRVGPGRPGQGRLVEIRSIEKEYPFYGGIKLNEGVFSPSSFYVSKDLADLWSFSGHEKFKIGEVELMASGIVQEDSSVGLRGFSLAPRVYLSQEQIQKSGLLKPGATGNYAYHFYLPSLSEEEIKELKITLYKKIKDAAVRVVLPEDSSAQSGRVLNTLANFMALSALIGLILSLVGVFYLYQSHLGSRLKDLCLLNLFGMRKSTIAWGIILQFSFMFLLVFFTQLLIVLPTYKTFAPLLSLQLGMDLSRELKFSSLLGQLPFLYLLSLSILIPLIFGLMRTSMGPQLKASKLSMGKFRFSDFLPFILGLWGYSCFLSQSWKTGSLFFVGLLIVFIISTFLIKFCQWSLKKLIMGKSLRYPQIEGGLALRSIVRSGHSLTLSFLSLAMGATLISLVLQLDHLIQKEFAETDNKPGLFIFDIQEEQIEDFSKFAQNNHAQLDGITPMIRARLDLVNGKKFQRSKSSFSARESEDDEESRARNTGLNLTYRGKLSAAEKIVDGEPFPESSEGEDRPPYVSLEKRWAQRMGVSLGDKLTFDIQGISFEGVVRNFREVKWTSFYPNFFVSVEPGFIDHAPKTFLAVLPSGLKHQKVTFQQKAVEIFPNISFIDVEELVGKLSSLFNKSRGAIEVISWLSLAVGFVILYGLSHDQVYRRYYDLALLKSLGFSSTSLRLNLLYEFGLVFFLAMSLGFFLGWAMAQAIGIEVFKLSFSVDWARVFIPGLILMIVCLVTILGSSWQAVRAKPRELLSE